MAKTLKLKRSVGLPLLTLYGLGNILGAGVYVLIGEVAGIAGYAAILSFMVACVIAAFTAFSYMELSSRYPKTAGVSIYLHQAFNIRLLSTLVGLMLVSSGIVSAATLARGCVGYVQQFIGAPDWLIITTVIVGLSIIALAGIAHSAKLAAFFTLVEIGGLILIVVGGSGHLDQIQPVLQQAAATNWLTPAILMGAFVAFYAFIGFEDMIEVVEEVKNPRRTMPKAILLCLAISTALYLLVLIASFLVLTPQQLADSDAPLAAVFTAATGLSPLILAAIALGAIINGILVQIIMGSRVLYGLASQGWIHGSLSKVHKGVRTPVAATVLVAIIILILALLFPLLKLAEFTSFLVLLVFAMVHASLLMVKRRGRLNKSHHVVPGYVPLIGLVLTTGMLVIVVLS